MTLQQQSVSVFCPPEVLSRKEFIQHRDFTKTKPPAFNPCKSFAIFKIIGHIRCLPMGTMFTLELSQHASVTHVSRVLDIPLMKCLKTEISLLDIKEAPSAGQGNSSVCKGLLTQIQYINIDTFSWHQIIKIFTCSHL